MDDLDQKLNEAYGGKVVRKDLLHRIKKGTNVPTFVLEFLLARYCASDDPDEIDAGMEAVLSTLQDNYVRPDESNKAQSYVHQHGKHRFIDKIHVTYKERERRHWAEMENFNSRRIAIPEKFYRGIDRILEGGIWAEALVAHNEVEEDDYAFLIEDLRPIQLSRFDFDAYVEGRDQFTRDEWLDVVVRTIGLEPSQFSFRQKLHLLARMIPFVEKNYNFIELGPRGTGKSYVFSEFSPYSTLLSGGQASTATLFYNEQPPSGRHGRLLGHYSLRRGGRGQDQGPQHHHHHEGLHGQRPFFSRCRRHCGCQLCLRRQHRPLHRATGALGEARPVHPALPPNFDLAIMDRFHMYVPGWEMPKNGSGYLTAAFGLITDYLAEAFHHLAKKVNRYDYVTNHCRFGKAVEGRDERGVKKTVCGPAQDPAPRRRSDSWRTRAVRRLRPRGPPPHQGTDEQTQSRRRVRPHRPVLLRRVWPGGRGHVYGIQGCPGHATTGQVQPHRHRLPSSPTPDPGAVSSTLAGACHARAGQCRASSGCAPDLNITCPHGRHYSHSHRRGNHRAPLPATASAPEPPLPTVGPVAETATNAAAPPPFDEPPAPADLQEKHFRIHYGDTGYT